MPKIWRKYVGTRLSDDDAVILVEHYEGPRLVRSHRLPLCLEIVNHSPTGFAWGYQGSGPSQTALAIIYDHLLLQTGNPSLARERALPVYQDFKRRAIARLNWNENFILTTNEVEKVLLEIEAVR